MLDRDELDGLHPAALPILLEQSLRFAAFEVVLLEQTFGETLFHQVPSSLSSAVVLLPDFDVRRQRAELFAPIVEATGVEVPRDVHVELTNRSGTNRAVFLLYSSVMPLLFGARHCALVDFDLATARTAASTLADRLQQGPAKKLAAGVATVLAHYHPYTLTGLGFSFIGRFRRQAVIEDVRGNELFERWTQITYQLGVQGDHRDCLRENQAVAREIARSVGGARPVRSRIWLAEAIPDRDLEWAANRLDSGFLPPVVETKSLGATSRGLAPLGGAYTERPTSARRDLGFG